MTSPESRIHLNFGRENTNTFEKIGIRIHFPCHEYEYIKEIGIRIHFWAMNTSTFYFWLKNMNTFTPWEKSIWAQKFHPPSNKSILLHVSEESNHSGVDLAI